MSKAIVNSLLFNAEIGNVQYIRRLSEDLSAGQREAIRTIIAELTPAGTLPFEQRQTLRERISVLLPDVQPGTQFTPIRDLMPDILSYLPKKDKAQAARVSSFFHEPVPLLLLEEIKTKTIWTFKELEKYRRIYHFDSLAKVLQIYPESSVLITDLDLSNGRTNFKIDDASFLELIKLCPNLTGISLNRCAMLTENSVPELIQHCPHLTYISLPGCTWLKDNSVIEIARSYPLLEIIDLSNCRDLTNNSLIRLAQSCPRLTNINCRNCKMLTDASLMQIAVSCPLLKSIDFSFCARITDASVLQLTLSCPLLTHILLGYCPLITDDSVSQIAQTYPNLESIKLSRCEGITDDSVMLIAQRCPRLSRIALDHCEITDAAVFELAQRCPHLTTIDMFGCLELTDASICRVAVNCTRLIRIDIGDSPNLSDVSWWMLAKNASQLILDENDEKIRFFRQELAYRPNSHLGHLYHSVITQSPLAAIQKLLSGVQDQEILNLIHFHAWDLAGRPDGANWGSLHVLDDMNGFFIALRRSIEDRLKQLPEQEKNGIYGSIYRLAGSPQTDDPQWGEHHAADNLARLADALS